MKVHYIVKPSYISFKTVPKVECFIDDADVFRVLAALLDYAREAWCYKVILDCSDQNVAFYEKCGFEKKEVQMVGLSLSGLIEPMSGFGLSLKALFHQQKQSFALHTFSHCYNQLQWSLEVPEKANS